MITMDHWGLICGVLSLLSILIATLIFIIIQSRISSFFAKLAVYLLVADVPFLLTSFVGIPITSPVSMFYCQIASFTVQFSTLSTIFWNYVIIWTVYHTVRFNLQEEELVLYKPKFLALSYLMPIFIAVIPILMHLGTGSSCWVELPSEPSPEFYVYHGLYLFGFTVSFLIILSYYIRLCIFLRQFTIEEVSGEFYKLMVFPIILLVVNLPDASDRVMRIFFDTTVATWVIQAQVILRQSQALCNGIIFLLSPRVRSGIRRFLRSRRSKRDLLPSVHSSARASMEHPIIEGDDASINSVDSVERVDHSGPFMDKAVPRRFTDHPELIYKIFDLKSSVNGTQNSNKRTKSTGNKL